MINRWIFLVVFSMLSMKNVDAQEMWGPSHSNYAGQYGLDLNPASIAGVPYRWELHFLSMDASILNNYMYLKSQSKLIAKGFKGETIDDEKLTDRYTKNPEKFAYGSVFLKYPAFIWAEKKWSAGFHVSTRAEISAVNVPYHLAKYLKEGFDYDPQQNTNFKAKNTKAALMNWHELGLSYARVLYDDQDYFVTGGITANYLHGLNGMYLNLDAADYIVPADTLLVVYDIVADYGHALPENGTKGSDSPLAKRGYGYSFSTGFQLYKNRNDNFYNPCKRSNGDKPYDFRLGVSLIDVGYLKYTSGTRTYKFNNLSTDWYGIDTTSFGGLVQTDSILSDQFYGNARRSRDKRSMTMYLPTAASLQFDVAITEHYFVNLSVIQRVPLGKNSIRRANQIAITPRFESRRMEIALPISYYEMFRPRVGLSFRFGVFTIGTDMISPLLGITDSYGADLYFGIAWRNFGGCDVNKNRGRRKSKIENCFDMHK